MESEFRREAEKGASAPRERRSAADVVAPIAGKREIVNRQQQPLYPERPQRLADELAQRCQPFSGTSQTVPSGGSVRSADCAWPSHGSASTSIRSGLMTPDPP